MQLHERLTQLVGHEIFVITCIQNEDNHIPGGTLQEVGTDYLVVKTEDTKSGDQVQLGAEWLVALTTIVNIIHGSKCPKCIGDTKTSRRPPKTPTR
jgi:hypothetical protein